MAARWHGQWYRRLAILCPDYGDAPGEEAPATVIAELVALATGLSRAADADGPARQAILRALAPTALATLDALIAGGASTLAAAAADPALLEPVEHGHREAMHRHFLAVRAVVAAAAAPSAPGATAA